MKKIGEEAAEVIMASKDAAHHITNTQPLIGEMADLWFHSLVCLAYHGLHPNDVLAELDRREGVGGLLEKASRPA